MNEYAKQELKRLREKYNLRMTDSELKEYRCNLSHQRKLENQKNQMIDLMEGLQWTQKNTNNTRISMRMIVIYAN